MHSRHLPCSVPTVSCRTIATGARQSVVHGVRDDVMRFGVIDLVEVHAQYERRVRRLGAFAGAEMITFRAPASRC